MRILHPPTRKLRELLHRLHRQLGGRHWFPHVPLALLLGLGGGGLLYVDLGGQWRSLIGQAPGAWHVLNPTLLPPILIGLGMLVMTFGLLFRSRIAWAMALLLAGSAAVSMLLGQHRHAHLLLGYFVLMLALLSFAWRQFDRSSIAASSLFALTSVVMLVVYATLGAFYLGADYKPAITDLVTALYFAMVTMSTVGYGDITPQTAEAKLFTVSIIVLGVAVFATSLTAVIAPLVSRSLQRIVNSKGSRMQRQAHFVVIGHTPLALNTVRELRRRGQAVTLLMRTLPDAGLPDGVDQVLGEPSDSEVLRKAGADKARAVLAMLEDDSENAFVILAVRELAGSARTVAAVNDARHLARVKLVQPDVVIAPQILGGELAAMLMTGEQVSAEFILQRVFQNTSASDTLASKPQP